jgi:hypothetical protein
MQGHHHDHRLGHEVMDAPQHPAAGHFVLDVIRAFISRLARRAVGHPQEDAGEGLRHEGEDEHAARDVAETGAAGNPLVQRFVREGPQARAVVNPDDQAANHGNRIS